MANWIDQLNSIDGIIAKSNQDLHRHTPLRVGGKVDCWIRCKSRTALLEALPIIRKQSWRIHWPFQDWLVKDGGIKGCIVRLEDEFEEITQQHDRIELGTAALWSQTGKLDNSATELQYWPGSVGSVLYGPDIKHLKGFNLELEWIRGRGFETKKIQANENFEIPKTVVPTKITIIGTRKKRKNKPLGAGFAFIVDKKNLSGDMLTELRLNSVRLRNWKVSPINPDQVIHIGCKEFNDVTLLQKALNQKISQIRKGSLQFRLPIIGRNKK